MFALIAGATPRAAAGIEPAGVYLEPADTPAARRLNVAPDRLATEGLIVVRSATQLQSVVAQQHPAAIWINETALDQVPREWLHTQFQQSVVIVGINMTVRELATAVGADPTWDWSSEWRHPSKPTFVAMYRADFTTTNGEGRPSESHRRGFLNDSYNPQDPVKLFGWVRVAVRQAHQPNEGPVPTPFPDGELVPTGIVIAFHSTSGRIMRFAVHRREDRAWLPRKSRSSSIWS